MEVTPEMIDAYITDKYPWLNNADRVRVYQGIAIYTHLQSSGSNEWKEQHGFIKDKEQ